MRIVADRIGAFAWLCDQLGGRRNELPRDGVVRIIGIDQPGNVWRHRDRIARSDPLEIGEIDRAREPAGDEFARLAQWSWQFSRQTRSAHVSPAGGVHTT